MKEFTLPTYAEATLDGLPLITYMEIVCCVPKGSLVTKEAILALASEQLNHKYTRVASNGWFVPNMRADIYVDSGYAFREYKSAHPGAEIPNHLMIPHWRVVSSDGKISHNEYDDYAERLRQDGFTITEEGKIEDFENYLFNLSGIHITAPKLGKSVKSETYEIFGRIGDPIYSVECPNYSMRFEKVMKFKVYHDSKHDYIEAIKITSEGIKYFYDDDDTNSCVSPDDLVFFSKTEAADFIRKYCTAFNEKKYKFNTAIYTKNGREILEGAGIAKDHEIYFITNGHNKYFLKDENKTFSFDPEFIRRYLIVKTTIADGTIISSEYLGECTGLHEAKKMLSKLQKKYSASEQPNGNLSYTENDRIVIIHLTDKGVV